MVNFKNWTFLIAFMLFTYLIVAWKGIDRNAATLNSTKSTSLSTEGTSSEMFSDELKTIQVFKENAASVVNISTSNVHQDYWTMNVMEVPEGTGTGFIWDYQGHIVTNYHVIKDASLFKVNLHDQTSWDAELVGVAPAKDLAVLRLVDYKKAKLRPINIDQSVDLEVGQTVLAIGNPFGLDHTLTKGIISALGREITAPNNRKIKDVIQTDAAINPGNSGGPLLNSSGRLIGVNTAIYSPSGAYAGIGFSIPADIVIRVVPDLIKYGKINKPSIGVVLTRPQILRSVGLSKGVMIYDIWKNSPADKADLLPIHRNSNGQLVIGDVIIKMDGVELIDNGHFDELLDQKKIGQKVDFIILRAGQLIEKQLVLSEAIRFN